MLKTSNPFDNLSIEAKAIFGLIHKKGPLTKNSLSLLSNLSLSTLNRIMQTLEEASLIIQNGMDDSSGGRKPALYDVTPGDYYLIGIDISRTYSQVIITNLKMDMIKCKQFPMDASSTPIHTTGIISEMVQELLIESGIKHSSLLGAGLATVGPLDKNAGTMINPARFPSSGWNNAPITNLIAEKLQLPVVMDNGANTAAIAEFLLTPMQNIRNMSYLNCGIGIRAGTISSGIIVRSINDAEDAFGHMAIDVDGEKCECGNHGCIECYASIPAIVKKFSAALKKGRKTTVLRDIDEISYIDICKAAELGDETARTVIIDAASMLGSGLANYINLLSPELIVLSGPLIKHSELFYNVCTDVAAGKHYMNKNSTVTFSRGGCLKDNAMSIGAALLLMEYLINNTKSIISEVVR